jgi:deoxycytidylate deaminase
VRHINIALVCAERSTFKQRIGAVVFKGSRILGTGFNQTNRHQSLVKTSSWPGSVHAEVSAIADAIRNYKDVRGADMLVVRLKRTGDMGLAMPCEACYNVLKSVGIRRVNFSDVDGFGCITF